jgi:anti-sigma factor RsiW
MPSSNTVPEWILERVVQGDLSEAERAAVQGQLDADPSIARRLADIRASDGEVRARLPAFARLEERARAARKERRKRRGRWAMLAPALVAAAVLMMVLRPQDTSWKTPRGEEITRVKGAGRLIVYRKTAGGSEPLRHESAARPGEIVQIGYSVARDTYGVIISVDGRGAVTLHHPESPTGSTQLGVNGLLPAGYQLDDAPGFERFILVTARTPVPVARVLQSARMLAPNPQRARDGRLSLPDEFAQSFVLVWKVQP